MPTRAMWKGSIGFSLVNIPVSLSPAVREQDLRFHQLHDADGGRIREKRFCEKDGEEVPYEHIIKGFELDKHHMVKVTRDELKALEPKSDKIIAIENFVKLEEVDPLYYERSYLRVSREAGREGVRAAGERAQRDGARGHRAGGAEHQAAPVPHSRGE